MLPATAAPYRPANWARWACGITPSGDCCRILQGGRSRASRLWRRAASAAPSPARRCSSIRSRRSASTVTPEPPPRTPQHGVLVVVRTPLQLRRPTLPPSATAGASKRPCGVVIDKRHSLVAVRRERRQSIDTTTSCATRSRTTTKNTHTSNLALLSSRSTGFTPCFLIVPGASADRRHRAPPPTAPRYTRVHERRRPRPCRLSPHMSTTTNVRQVLPQG